VCCQGRRYRHGFPARPGYAWRHRLGAIIVGGPFDAQLSNAEIQYLISAGLISSGLLSMIQIYRFKLGNTGYYMGTGLVSVLGTSFTFVPIARTSIDFMMKEDSSNPCKSDVVCVSFALMTSSLFLP